MAENSLSSVSSSALEIAYEKVDYLANPNKPLANDIFRTEAAFFGQSSCDFDFTSIDNQGQLSKCVSQYTDDGHIGVSIEAKSDDPRGVVELQRFPLSNPILQYNIGDDWNMVSHQFKFQNYGCVIVEKYYISFNDIDQNTSEYVDLSANLAPGGVAFTQVPHPTQSSVFNEAAGVYTPVGQNQYLLLEIDPSAFNGFNLFQYVAGTTLPTPSSGSNASLYATYYRPLKKTSEGWVNYVGSVIPETDPSFHTRQDLIVAGVITPSTLACADFASQPKWIVPGTTPTEYELIRQEPVSPMDLTDITATNTVVTITDTNTNPGTNDTFLVSGSITRVSGDKAYCSIEIRTDDSSTVQMTFGSSIVPSGAEILEATVVASNVDQDGHDLRRINANTLEYDRIIAGDTTLNIGFWVGGLPDFVEFSIQKV